MRTVEFELERRITAPVEQVYARLVDIEGHNAWMPRKGSIRKHTRQTSPGETTVGTTYVDETKQGPLPGEVLELEAGHRVVYHWWDASRRGKLRSEGWPSYVLTPAGDGETLVRHHARLNTYGLTQMATPIFRRLALRERTVTIDGLKASFETSGTRSTA